MVVMEFERKPGRGTMNPSSDTPTHVELYKGIPEIGGIVHAPILRTQPHVRQAGVHVTELHTLTILRRDSMRKRG